MSEAILIGFLYALGALLALWVVLLVLGGVGRWRQRRAEKRFYRDFWKSFKGF